MVYVIQQRNNGPIKIGKSGDLINRMGVLKQGNPYSFQILAVLEGGAELERRLHQRFSRYRIYGEWFHPANEIIREFRILNDGDQSCLCGSYEVKITSNISPTLVRAAARRLDANIGDIT